MRSKSIPFLYESLTISICLMLCIGCPGCAANGQSSPSADMTTIQSGVLPENSTVQETRINALTLGVGDSVDIEVYRHADLKRTLTIEEGGKINFPLIGDIEAAGLTAIQLRGNIQKALSNYIVDPQVMVSVKEMHSQRVYVLGEVVKPGVFAMGAPMNVFEAVSHAGGFTLDAQDESVMVIRGDRTKPQLLQLDLESVLSKGNISQDIQLQGGDIVYIPPTYLADVSRFSMYLKNILSPILMFEQGVILGDELVSIIEGSQNETTTNIVVHP